MASKNYLLTNMAKYCFKIMDYDSPEVVHSLKVIKNLTLLALSKIW
jgi:hypothetical protein